VGLDPIAELTGLKTAEAPEIGKDCNRLNKRWRLIRMDRNRGLIVLGGSVALLVAGAAITYFVRKERYEEAREAEKKIEAYEKYVNAEPKPKRKPRATHTNGKLTKA
jgi:hypothetical protein